MKKLLIGLAVLVALVIVAALAVPFLIPTEVYTSRVVAAVKAATGRDLKIAGPVRFSLLPSLALEANDVSFSNPPGASTPDMARIKTLAVALKLLPLLHGEIAIERFDLVQPVIALEIDKQGRPNWRFSAATPATAAAPAPAAPPSAPGSPASPSAAGFPALSLATLSITDGQASYVDQRSGTSRVLSNIAMTLALPGGDQPFTGKGSAVWNGESAALTFGVDRPATLEAGGASPIAISVAAKPVNFAFKGSATGATLAKLEGGIDLSVPSIRGLAKWVGIAFDPPGTGFGEMTLSGQVAVAGSKIAFTQAVLALDGMKGTGALTVDSSGAVPNVSGRLDLDKLDVNPYLPPDTKAGATGAASPAPPPAAAGGAPPASPSGAASATASGWSTAPIDLAPLKLANADFALSTNALLYRKIAIGRSALALHLKNGRLDADLSEMALYQGKGQGKVTVDGSGAAPAIALQFNLAGVAMQPLLRDAAAFDRLSGNGSMTIDVTGHGQSQRDIIGTLAGKGSLDLANGKIEGVDLVSVMKKTAEAVVGAAQGKGGATDFGSLTGTYTIADGILHNNDLKLVSPEVPMTGAGTVDLPKREVAYRLTPSVAGIAVPVDVSGPWDNLRYRPDLSGLVKELPNSAGKLLQQLDKSGGSSGGGLGGALKGLLGR